jgi:hypothetical protein
MKMFLPPKNLSHIVYHPFQMMSNINRCTISIQDIRNIFKRKATWVEQFKRLNLKGQIQNEIGFSYLGHLGVGLI